jgi:coenzyme F420-reducing hydrogenase delta subunit
MPMPFEPVIVGFLCNWCSYSGADKAGSAKIGYPQNLRAVRVMCSGRVEPELVLQAFRAGADGVLICGCHPGDCHYVSGNHKAARRHALLRRVLSDFGIEADRCRLEWVSATESERFAAVVRDMTEKVRAMGSLDWNASACSPPRPSPRTPEGGPAAIPGRTGPEPT